MEIVCSKNVHIKKLASSQFLLLRHMLADLCTNILVIVLTAVEKECEHAVYRFIWLVPLFLQVPAIESLQGWATSSHGYIETIVYC